MAETDGVRWSAFHTEIVALCGSRSAEAIQQAEMDLSLAGKIVLAPFALAHLARAAIGQKERAVLDGLHPAKIELADEIVVVNPDGYVVETGYDEIVYALNRGKPVSFTEAPVTMRLRPEFFDAMLAGTKTVDVRRLDFKRAKVRPAHALRFESEDGRSLLARAIAVAKAPAPSTLIESVDPKCVVPGADREDLMALLDEMYPGIAGSSTPMVAITVSVLGEERRPSLVRNYRLASGGSVTWSDTLPPSIPVTGAAGWLVDPFDGRVLVRYDADEDADRRFSLPGGRIEEGDDGDLGVTLAREAAEESQVEIDPMSAVLLGYQIVTGHPRRPGAHAKARFLAPISLYEPIGPDSDDPQGRTFRRFMTDIDRAVELLGDHSCQRERGAVRAAARALGLPVDDPAPEGFRDHGGPGPLDPGDRQARL